MSDASTVVTIVAMALAAYLIYERTKQTQRTELIMRELLNDGEKIRESIKESKKQRSRKLSSSKPPVSRISSTARDTTTQDIDGGERCRGEEDNGDELLMLASVRQQAITAGYIEPKRTSGKKKKEHHAKRRDHGRGAAALDNTSAHIR